MIYNLPVKVFEETFSLENNKSELVKFGKNALIVTGRNSAKNCGALGDVTTALDSLSISYEIFDKVEENPSTETIGQAVDFARNYSVDFVIGIGGGSPMDAAKSIALLLNHPNASIRDLYDPAFESTALPVVAIPTTCGTGSEVTGVSVLTRHDKKSKGSIPHKIFPTIAFVDWRYLVNLPERILKSSAIDALCHATESLICAKSNDFSSMFALEALRHLGNALPKLRDGQKDESVLSELLHASTLAGMAIAHTGTAIPHALSYRLTYNNSVVHGFACAYFLPDYVKISSSTHQIQLLNALNLTSVAEFYDLVYDICDFSDIKKETVDLAKAELKNNPAKLSTAPFDVSSMLD